jgi:hypothetical protein
MPDSPARQLASFISKFTPEMARRIRACRSAMRAQFPTANELVYDNYNFLVIAYGPTERPSECVFALAVNAKGIGLHFLNGASLQDRTGMLQGSGTQNRFVRLAGAATLSQPAVAALLAEAAARADVAFGATGRGTLIIRSISAKQRPRREGATRTARRRQ